MRGVFHKVPGLEVQVRAVEVVKRITKCAECDYYVPGGKTICTSNFGGSWEGYAGPSCRRARRDLGPTDGPLLPDWCPLWKAATPPPYPGGSNQCPQ